MCIAKDGAPDWLQEKGLYFQCSEPRGINWQVSADPVAVFPFRAACRQQIPPQTPVMLRVMASVGMTMLVVRALVVSHPSRCSGGAPSKGYAICLSPHRRSEMWGRNTLTYGLRRMGPQPGSDKQVRTGSPSGRILRTGTSIVLSTVLILLLAQGAAHDNRRQRADYKKQRHGWKQFSAQRKGDIKSPKDRTDSDNAHWY